MNPSFTVPHSLPPQLPPSFTVPDSLPPSLPTSFTVPHYLPPSGYYESRAAHHQTGLHTLGHVQPTRTKHAECASYNMLPDHDLILHLLWDDLGQ